ncbi:hypothetical protein, partial [Amycolatopsis acidiphila]
MSAPVPWSYSALTDAVATPSDAGGSTAVGATVGSAGGGVSTGAGSVVTGGGSVVTGGGVTTGGG